MPNPAVLEIRTYYVSCSRRITTECAQKARVKSESPNDGAPRSITAAIALFREKGWTLHEDGRASCGPCVARWDASTQEDS